MQHHTDFKKIPFRKSETISKMLENRIWVQPWTLRHAARPPWHCLWWWHPCTQGRGHIWLCLDLIWAIWRSWRSITQCECSEGAEWGRGEWGSAVGERCADGWYQLIYHISSCLSYLWSLLSELMCLHFNSLLPVVFCLWFWIRLQREMLVLLQL